MGAKENRSPAPGVAKPKELNLNCPTELVFGTTPLNVGKCVVKLLRKGTDLTIVDDDDFYKAQSVGISNTQLYKQAGNSIVVNVLEKIFNNLLKGEKE